MERLQLVLCWSGGTVGEVLELEWPLDVIAAPQQRRAEELGWAEMRPALCSAVSCSLGFTHTNPWTAAGVRGVA